jgi:hypothetical protein
LHEYGAFFCPNAKQWKQHFPHQSFFEPIQIGIVTCTITSVLFIPLSVSVHNQFIVIHQLKGDAVIKTEDIKETGTIR